ncbi:MAG: ribosomal L7Ae/L30e/S12e/Gadd45 family protein [Oscillospiraceae bacterium]|nr:ribosomal L7Ae/L30e/S12e/Gadd45 family protein [Oscillospiraceae bacterium]
MDNILSLLGLAKKAGRLEAGEDAVGACAKAHGARLILLASDAAENTARRAARFSEEGACLCARIDASRDELGRAVGRASCAVLALTDIGFASAAAKKLAERDAAKYGELAERLSVKAARAAERKEAKKKTARKPRGK